MKILLFILVLMVSLQAQAQNTKEACYRLSDIAELVMQYRQSRADRLYLMNELTGESSQNLVVLTRAVVNTAYLWPIEATSEAKHDSVYRFKMATYKECLAGF